MSDIEIARAANMHPITEVAEKVGIPANALELYGNSKAKLSQEFIKSLEGRPDHCNSEFELTRKDKVFCSKSCKNYRG